MIMKDFKKHQFIQFLIYNLNEEEEENEIE